MMHPGISGSMLELKAPSLPAAERLPARDHRQCFRRRNSIVVLPTGAGKTLIASELIRRLGPQCVFLVPTCLLVEQQSRAIRD